MKTLTLSQFVKRKKHVEVLIDRAELIADGAKDCDDPTFGQLLIAKYGRISERLQQYQDNLKIRLQASMLQSSHS